MNTTNSHLRKLRNFLICVFLCFSIGVEAYDLSVCAIFRNSGLFLKEWINFHKLQGVEHFYLYNHFSTDNFQEILDPYIQSKEVTLVNWNYSIDPIDSGSWCRIQCGAYNHCLAQYGSKNQWIAVIDSDEFLFCPTGKLLTEFLKDYSQYGGVGANWLMFGTSNVEEIPQGFLITEMLTHCNPYDNTVHNHIKSVVQPSCVARGFFNPHFCEYKPGKYAVDAKKKLISGPFSSEILLNDIRINHYWTGPKKYFDEIKRKNTKSIYQGQEFPASFSAEMNDNIDTNILQYVPALKMLMQH